MSDIIAIVLGATGFIISIIGLIVTPLINLKSKRLEKRLEFRFLLFQKILELWEHTHKNNDIDQHLMFEINKDIQLYGYNTEVKLFRNAVYSYNQYIKERTDIKRKEMFQKFNKFFESSFNTYRREIVLNNLDDNIKE